MNRVVCVFLVAAALFAAPCGALDVRGVVQVQRETLARVASAHADAMRGLAHPHTHTRTALSSACAEKLEGYHADGCTASYLDMAMLLSSADPLAEMAQLDVDAFCAAGEGGCRAKLIDAVPVCVEGAHDEDEDEGTVGDAIAHALQRVELLTALTCVEVADEFCFDTYVAAFGQGGLLHAEGPQGDGNVSDDTFVPEALSVAQLRTLCTPCMQKVVGYVMALATDDVHSARNASLSAVVSLMCMAETPADGGEDAFCFGKVMDALDEYQCHDKHMMSNVAACNELLLSRPCTDPCFRRVYGMLMEHPEIGRIAEADAKSMDAALRLACRRNAQGNLCGGGLHFGTTYLFVGFDGYGTCAQSTLFAQGCADSGCKEAMAAAVGDVDCCLGSAVAFSSMHKEMIRVNMEHVKDTCEGMVALDACPRTGPEVKRTMVLRGVDLCAWFTSYRAPATVAVVGDLAGNFGLFPGTLSVIDPTCDAADDGGSGDVMDELKLTWVAQTDDDAHAAALETSFDGALARGNINLDLFTAAFGAEMPHRVVDLDLDETREVNAATGASGALARGMVLLAATLLLVWLV